jgi:hypothetical protein
MDFLKKRLKIYNKPTNNYSLRPQWPEIWMTFQALLKFQMAMTLSIKAFASESIPKRMLMAGRFSNSCRSFFKDRKYKSQ